MRGSWIGVGVEEWVWVERVEREVIVKGEGELKVEFELKGEWVWIWVGEMEGHVILDQFEFTSLYFDN